MSSYPPVPQAWTGSPTSAGEPTLDQPHHGIGLGPAVRRGFRKYATFSGRASRSEFWWWQLFVALGYVLLGGLALGVGLATSPNGGDDPGAAAWPLIVLFVVFVFGIVVPTVAVSVRRLHDANYSGWLYLLVLIPYLGSFLILIFCLLASSPHGARFDKNPGYAVAPPAYPQPPGTSYDGPWASGPGEEQR